MSRPGCEDKGVTDCGGETEVDCHQSHVSVFKRGFMTGRSVSKSKVEALTYTNLTQTSVVLSWNIDPCVNAYILLRSTDTSKFTIGSTVLAFSRWNQNHLTVE